MNANVIDGHSEKERIADTAENELGALVKKFYNTPAPEKLLTYQLAELLFRFRNIPTEKIDHVVQETVLKLIEHIKKYSLVSSDQSVNQCNGVIKKIGLYAAELLCITDLDYEYALAESKKREIANSSLLFQDSWLCNVPKLVPYDLDLMKITSYLLACYCANAKDNRIDPFTWYQVGLPDSELAKLTDEAKKQRQAVKEYIWQYTGWCDIFSEYWTDEVGNKSTSKQGSKVVRYSTDKNVKRNISKLASYLTEIPKNKDRLKLSSIVCLEGLDFSWKIKGKPYPEERRHEFSPKVKDWEVYRRFAAFCNACDEYMKQVKNGPKFNLTLSMALFARYWKCDLEEDFFDDDVELKEVSWEDVEADSLYDEIAEAVRYLSDRESRALDIYDIVYRKKERLLEYYGLDSVEIALQIPEDKQDDPERPQPGEPLFPYEQ